MASVVSSVGILLVVGDVVKKYQQILRAKGFKVSRDRPIFGVYEKPTRLCLPTF